MPSAGTIKNDEVVKIECIDWVGHLASGKTDVKVLTPIRPVVRSRMMIVRPM